MAAPSKEQQKKARQSLRQRLRDWGFTGAEVQEIMKVVEQHIQQGSSSTVKLQAIRDTKAYAQRFEGITRLRELNEKRIKQGKPPLNIPSEGEYIAVETEMINMMRRANLPPGFYDSRDDIGKFIGAGMSATELSERIQAGVMRARTSNAAARESLRLWYGLNDNDFAAFFLDETKTVELLQRQLNAALIAGQARLTEFGGINQRIAERLAAAGISEEQAREGFSSLASQKGLLEGLGNEEDITTEDAVAALFEGNAAAREKIERRREQRTAAFKGSSGGAVVSAGGFTGLASSTN